VGCCLGNLMDVLDRSFIEEVFSGAGQLSEFLSCFHFAGFDPQGKLLFGDASLVGSFADAIHFVILPRTSRRRFRGVGLNRCAIGRRYLFLFFVFDVRSFVLGGNRRLRVSHELSGEKHLFPFIVDFSLVIFARSQRITVVPFPPGRTSQREMSDGVRASAPHHIADRCRRRHAAVLLRRYNRFDKIVVRRDARCENHQHNDNERIHWTASFIIPRNTTVR
jgi:hypothetical protein